MPLVVTDFLSCGWSRVGTNFSEWVQIFQKNSFRGEPILGGSKLNVTVPAICVTFLGVEVDTGAMVLHLPQDKLCRLKLNVAEWQSRRNC